MDTKGILTLQFGHYSNFIGAHWWNIQEAGFEYNSSSPSEINHDVLYREGLTDKNQVTYTPRLLLVDLKGTLRTLSETGDLYESPPDPDKEKTRIGWPPSHVDIQAALQCKKNRFQKDLEDPSEAGKVALKTYDFDKVVQVWSDYLYARFHPRTVNTVKEYEHCNENTPFDVFPLGTSLWKTPSFEEDFVDKIRNYVEECDHFQGFQLLADSFNAFGGLASGCIEHLRDEYDRKSILVFPVIPSHFPTSNECSTAQAVMNDSVRTVNLALSFNQFASHSSFFVPLSTTTRSWRQPGPSRQFEYMNYDATSPYNTSAILAVALETLTMKHRLRSSGNFDLSDLTADLTLHGRKAVAASLRLPFAMRTDECLLDNLDRLQGPLTVTLTPNCDVGNARMMQHVCIRGVPSTRLKKPVDKAGAQRELPAYRCCTVEEMFQMYLSFATDGTASHVTTVNKPISVGAPFPRMFDSRLGTDGGVLPDDRKRNDTDAVERISTVSGLHNCPEVGDMLESLHTETRRIRISRLHQFTNEGGGIEKDDFEECLDNLFTLRENYEDNYVI
nr:unnamed protein product [Callosobruchus analis]